MNVGFDSDTLKRLLEDVRFTAGFSRDIVKAYRRRMQFILDANDERDLRNFKGLRYEKLKGNRAGQRSMRLNDQSLVS